MFVCSLMQAVDSYSKALQCCLCDDDAVLVNRAISYVVLGECELAMTDLNRASKY